MKLAIPTPRADAALDRLGIEFKRCGSELRTSSCSNCGDHARDATCIDIKTGVWCCHRCGAKGDLPSLVAGYRGEREVTRATFDFMREVAGDSAFEPTVPRPRVNNTTTINWLAKWSALDQRSLIGERYLDNRNLDSSELRLRNLVRFATSGNPAMRLFNLETGAVDGIQLRSAQPAEIKTPMMPGSKSRGSALGGRIAELDREGVDVAVVVEGFADTATATLAWPGCAVFGAAGAGQLARVAEAVARRVREVRGWLLLVPHDDEAGVAAGVAAVLAAQSVGLVLDRDLLLVGIGEHNDLADAWSAGWRWRWPNERGSVG